MSIAHLCLDLAHQYGVQFVGIAPGSRSSALVEAVVPDERFTLNTHFDERSLAFWALGIAKASGKPALIICTSGTAVANLYPAIVEAAESKVPLILLTADRQEHDKYQGANQTIYTQQLPLDYLSAYCALDAETCDPDAAKQALTQTLAAGQDNGLGPVQINIGFPDPNRVGVKTDEVSAPTVKFGTRPKLTLSTDSDWALAQKTIESVRRGCIVVGQWQNFEAIIPIAEQWNWPILVDIQSQGRLYEHPLVVNACELILEKEPALLDSDTVLWFGQRVVSKTLLGWMAERGVVQISDELACVDGGLGTRDERRGSLGTGGGVQRLVAASADALAQVATWRPNAPPTQALKTLSKANTTHLNTLKTGFSKTTLTEPEICSYLGSSQVPGHPCLIGNSLAIRLCNRAWLSRGDGSPIIYANRGASGIDGLISTAVGIAQASGKYATLIIGDISALYDINALFLVKRAPVPVHIWILNNNGGGIFRHLPIGSSDLCEPYFAQPPKANFKAAASMATLPYQSITSRDELNSVKTNPHQSILIECQVSSSDTQIWYNSL